MKAHGEKIRIQVGSTEGTGVSGGLIPTKYPHMIAPVSTLDRMTENEFAAWGICRAQINSGLALRSVPRSQEQMFNVRLATTLRPKIWAGDGVLCIVGTTRALGAEGASRQEK